jgi:hypothetical protein
MSSFTTFTKSLSTKVKSLFANDRVYSMFNSNQETSLINNTVKNDVLKNRYKYLQNDLFLAINLIATKASFTEYTIYKNGEPLDNENIVYKEIQQTLNSPSIRNQSFPQLVQEGVAEYLLNGILFTNFGIREDGTYFIQHLKSHELTPHKYNDQSSLPKMTQNEGLKSFVINAYKYTPRTATSGISYIFTLNEELGCYVYENKTTGMTQYILATDVEFEETETYEYTHLSKSILNKIYNAVYTQYLIKVKNQSLIFNTTSSNLLVVNGVNGETRETKNTISDAISKLLNTGKPSVVMTNFSSLDNPLKIESISITDKDMETKHQQEYDLNGGEIQAAFCIPRAYDVKEPKYNYANNKSVEFMNNAVAPNFNRYLEHLTKVFALLMNHNPYEYVFKANYSGTEIVKQTTIATLPHLQGVLTRNEIRKRLGEPPLTSADGDELYYQTPAKNTNPFSDDINNM